MDTVQFLNFLQSFASSASSRTQSQSGTESLSSTLSAFETQLRALMSPTQTTEEAGAPPLQAGASGHGATGGEDVAAPTSLFVIGGSAPPVGVVTSAAPVSESATSGAAAGAAAAEPASGVEAAPKPSFTAPLAALQQIVAWQREQIHPMLHVRIGDTWERQGIADPVNHPGLLAQAQQVYERAAAFKSHMPDYVAAWEKPWEAPPPVQMASAVPDTSGFVIGGRG